MCCASTNYNPTQFKCCEGTLYPAWYIWTHIMLSSHHAPACCGTIA
jgi:hypothetical protein